MLKSALFIMLSAFVYLSTQHVAFAATKTRTATTTTTDADNSKVNERDTQANQVTADDQSMGKSDTEITRLIRRELVKDDSLSTYAHNVKIITENGQVTLKGPVRTEEEKQKIANVATRFAQNKPVVNQLEIAP